MTLKTTLLYLITEFCRLTGRSETRVSTLLFGGGHNLDRLKRPKSDLTTGKYEFAMQWLSDNWPEDKPWPDAVDRPKPSENSENLEKA